MLIQEQDYLMHDAFLQHYGVPGMKWGVRKNKNVVNARNAMLIAKDAKKQANKKYSNDYDNAYNYSARHLISQYFGKNKKVSDKKWSDAAKSARDADKAKKAYKDAKKAYKDAKKTAKAEYKAKYKKALNNNKNKLDKLNKAWDKDSEKADKLFESTYNKEYNKAIKSGMKKSKADKIASSKANDVLGKAEDAMLDKYVDKRKKLKQDRYYIKKIGV